MRELAEAAGLTERATQMIVADLEEAGYVTRARVGRRNHYTVHVDQGFRHVAQDGHRIGSLLSLLASEPEEVADDAPAADFLENAAASDPKP
jgi:DNA-binding MarR family transcriptional regulator